MKSKKEFLLFLLFACALSAHSQCLLADSVWKQVERFRESKMPFDEEVKQLKALKEKCISCKTINDSGYANLLQRIGALSYLSGDLENAVIQTREAIQAGSGQSKALIPAHLGKSYFNLGMSYKFLNRFTDALEAFDSAIFYARLRTDFNKYAVRAYINIANIRFFKGDYQRSISYADMGALLAKASGDSSLQASCLREKAQSSGWMNLFDQSEKAIEESIRLYKALSKNGQDIKIMEELANSYTVYADLFSRKGNQSSAISYYEKAFAIFKKTGNNVGSYQAANNAAHIYYEIGSTVQSRKKYALALQFGNDAYDTARYYVNIAALDGLEKKYDAALENFQSAFHTLPIGYNQKVLLSNPSVSSLMKCSDKILALDLLLLKGKALLEDYQRSKRRDRAIHALETFELADHLVNQLRYEQESLISQLFWRKKTNELYERAISVCYELERPIEAFYFFEKSRAVLLHDELNETDWLKKKDLHKFNRQVALKKSLTRLSMEHSIPADPTQQKIQIALQLEYEGLLDSVKKMNPYYYQSFIDTGIVSVDQVQQVLPDKNTLLLELFTGDSATYALSITKEKVSLQKINSGYYDSLVNKFLGYCTNAVQNNQDWQGFIKTATKLYNLILPIKAPGINRLIVSPGDRFFPLEALIVSAKNNIVEYLVEHCMVSYTYSANFLFSGFSSKSNGSSFAGFAPVTFNPSLNMTRLSGSDRSLGQLASNFKVAQNFIGGRATKSSFLTSFSQFNIVQLYTHASDTTASGLPAIYFSDSVLYLSELVSDQSVRTVFIGLSGCETGGGRLYRGEGIFSFNRAFAAIGIPSSMTNLWQVDDQSTYILTEAFYANLKKGYTKDEALSLAKSNWLKNASKEKRLPFFWAAPVIVGNTDPLFNAIPENNSMLVVVAVGMVLLLVGFSFTLRRKPSHI